MQSEKSARETTIDRRKFTLASAMAILSGVVITITESCGSSSPSSPNPNPSPTANGDKVGAISSNHGHSAVITAARLSQGGALNLDIQGIATHTHKVDLSAGDMTAIAANQQVSRQSTTDSGHSHTVTFN